MSDDIPECGAQSPDYDEVQCSLEEGHESYFHAGWLDHIGVPARPALWRRTDGE